jgi:hypothetical protein
MHDLPQQDGVHLLPLPAFPELPTEVLRGDRRRSGRVRDRKRTGDFHANVLNSVVTCSLAFLS